MFYINFKCLIIFLKYLKILLLQIKVSYFYNIIVLFLSIILCLIFLFFITLLSYITNFLSKDIFHNKRNKSLLTNNKIATIHRSLRLKVTNEIRWINYPQGSAKGKRHSCVDFFEADAFSDGTVVPIRKIFIKGSFKICM